MFDIWSKEHSIFMKIYFIYLYFICLGGLCLCYIYSRQCEQILDESFSSNHGDDLHQTEISCQC